MSKLGCLMVLVALNVSAAEPVNRLGARSASEPEMIGGPA